MAYLDLTAGYTAPQGATRSAAATLVDLSPLEWQVVTLARRDTLGSLVPPGRFMRAVRRAFGYGRSLMLADPRLEALRRVAVHAWHRGYAVPSNEIKRVVAAGFTIDQVEALFATVSGERLAARRRPSL